MIYFKKACILAVLLFTVYSCSSDNDNTPELAVEVVSFEPSYNEVKLEWELTRPENIIIQDVHIYRTARNNGDTTVPLLIANLPSNTTSFIDDDIPYMAEISYVIKINYTSTDGNYDGGIPTLESEPQVFSRNIVMFDQVPFQVQEDPLQAGVYHILDKSGAGFLKKYDSSQNLIAETKAFTDGPLLNNRFHFVNSNEIYIADTQGKITSVRTSDYQATNTYYAAVTDNLNAFAVDGNRIYYQDEEVLWFYDKTTNASNNLYIGTTTDYIEILAENTFLFLYNQHGCGAAIYSYTPQNCTGGGGNCTPEQVAGTNGAILSYNAIDPNIFVWNSARSKFITSVGGRIYDINTLQEEVNLSEITGNRYFHFAFDDEGNIYATVQEEKVIHKFNSTYELTEVIPTKLYPLYPLITDAGLSVIGSYELVTYYNFDYGYNFNFPVQSAIEILQ